MIEDFEIIRARTKDDTAVLIDRLMKSKRRKVVLVLPKNSILTADLNSLKILKEEAESVDKNLYISAENNDIKIFAEKIQLPIYDSELLKREKEVKRMLDIVPPSFKRTQELPEESELAPEPEVDFVASQQESTLEKNLEDFYGEPQINFEPASTGNVFKKTFSFNRLITFFVGAGVLLLMAAMYLILPKANVEISLKEVPVKAAIAVAISKSVNSSDLANGIIPGQYFLLTKFGSKPIETAAVNDASLFRAGGTINIYNAYSATSQKLVAQTRFETKDGKIFRIKNPIIVPGAKMTGTRLTPASVKVEVISDGTGEEYLIGPSYFTIPGFKESPKYAGFYAESAEAMVPMQNGLTVLNQNIEKTKGALKDELANEAKNEILNAIKDSDLKLIEGASTVKIDEFKVSGQNLTMKISWQAIFFKENDFRALVDYFVSNKYSDLKNFEFKDNIAYPQVARSDFKKGEIFFTFNLNKDNAFTVDLAGLKKELAGLDENGMRNVISNKNFINNAALSLWPFWPD